LTAAFLGITAAVLVPIYVGLLAILVTSALYGFTVILERLFGVHVPRATVTQTTERFDLKSCPEGYVVIRRMTYGEKLNRQDDMMNMQTTADPKDKEMRIQIMAKKVALQDFANLVVEHNLTDENDTPLNFKNPAHVNLLDPQIGEEIGRYIDQINSFEEDAAVKNF
jgi:hypothetical protein